MGERLGHDFSRVRIHADTRAARLAAAVGARAFTAGHHIVFGAGEYAPRGTEGKRLLAHELAHTLQQTGPGHLQRTIAIAQTGSRAQGSFGFRLQASGLSVPCGKLLWEQWITGGLTYLYRDGSVGFKPACAWISHPQSRRAGDWCEDLIGLQRPGPRPINPAYGAKCGGTPDMVLYEFDDAPGTSHNVGDAPEGKEIALITFDIGIDHKLWDARYDSMFLEKVFHLRGKRGWGKDETRIDP